jgi:hypothetical protein
VNESKDGYESKRVVERYPNLPSPAGRSQSMDKQHMGCLGVSIDDWAPRSSVSSSDFFHNHPRHTLELVHSVEKNGGDFPSMCGGHLLQSRPTIRPSWKPDFREGTDKDDIKLENGSPGSF